MDVDLAGATAVMRQGRRVWLRLDPNLPVAPLIAQATARYPVVDIALEESGLEEVVRRIFEEGRREE